MSKVSIELKYGKIMAQLQEEANKICYGGGVYIGTKEYSYGTMIYLSYGDKEYEFNPDGYNFLYVLQQLTNNPVMDAILE